MRRPSARLVRIDPQLLYPVKHRSAKAQADLTVIRARAGLVRARTALVNTVRGLAKSYGERLRGCNVRNMNPEKAQRLSPELQTALLPLLAGIESLSEQIREYNERIETLAQQSYPQVAQLKQVKGVGTPIALTFLLTLERCASLSQEPGRGLLSGTEVAAPVETRTPNLHRAKQNRSSRVRMEGWRQWRLGGEETGRSESRGFVLVFVGHGRRLHSVTLLGGLFPTD